MSYQIEVLAIKAGLYESIQTACSSLNKVQNDFEFKIPSDVLRSKLFIEHREKYNANDAFAWLKTYRAEAKGNRQFSILVVDGPLSSDKWENIFGSFSRQDNLAVFTMHDFDHFVNDVTRFCRYYLVRYAINFLQPKLQSHNLTERKNCIFHFKQDKHEIKLSLDSGHICEPCLDMLRPKLTNEINSSIQAMLQVVSNQHPYSLVIKGGGVKGLAFAGALLELESHFSFDGFAGTSAGAITAILLGAGFKPHELKQILDAKDFNDFKDAGWFQRIVNFARYRFLFPGETFQTWMEGLLRRKFPNKLRNVELSELPSHTVVYCSRTQDGIVTFDSKGERNNSHASFAARCSMSIPLFFKPVLVDNINVYDGGLRCNFPLKVFMESYPQKLIMGLYLVSDAKNNGSTLDDITNIAIDGEEFAIVEAHLDKVVVIDPRPIKTKDFNLTKVKKEYLLTAGRIGALKFLKRNRTDISIDQSRLDQLQKSLKKLKKKF